MNKREFFKRSLSVAGGTILNVPYENELFFQLRRKSRQKSKNGLVFRFKPYTLQLKHTFTLATSSRTSTPGVLTEFEYEGFTGYGEASMPPYLAESQESVMNYLSLLDFSGFASPFLLEDILEYSGSILPGNFAAKASVDIALHDLTGKLLGQPLYRIYGLNPEKAPLTSFTIGLDTPEIVKEKVKEADPYRILKVKLGRENDREMINVIRSLTDKPICVDINQGWKDRVYALDMAKWLKEQDVIFLEQPMPKEQKDDIAWLTQQSPLPVIGDEAIQNVNDIVEQQHVYSGINIKLMKCGGLNAAMKMINVARALGLKVMIGCMTETSCAVSAAAQLSPLVDWCDLDGNLLISNDPFDGLKIINGRITLPDRSGIGVVRKG
jgi:L-alanine-DL-glutamate epimerase-like enolase superfamily enzyme